MQAQLSMMRAEMTQMKHAEEEERMARRTHDSLADSKPSPPLPVAHQSGGANTASVGFNTSGPLMADAETDLSSTTTFKEDYQAFPSAQPLHPGALTYHP